MTDCLRLGSLSGSSLKVIAIVSMTIDHLGLYFLGGEDAASGSVTYHLMRMVGRLAFPIFAFLLVEGYVHTRDIRKYMLNLFVAAVISDIPWMLLGGFDSHNVMFTLLMGLMAVSFIDRFWQRRFLTLTFIAMIGALAEWLQTDYSWRGICLICVLFMFREKPLLAFMFGLPLMMVYGLAGCAAGLLMPMLYSGRRGFASGWVAKYFFYAFYPLHLMAIWLLL